MAAGETGTEPEAAGEAEREGGTETAGEGGAELAGEGGTEVGRASERGVGVVRVVVGGC